MVDNKINKKYILIDIQFFGEKTEEPTDKKIEDTRKKGQVAQSKELTGAISLFVAVYMVKIFGLEMLEVIVRAFEYFTSKMYQNDFTLTFVLGLFYSLIIFTTKTVLFVVIPVFITSFIIQWLQVGQLITFDTLKPKLSRINPIEGFKRMFSMQSVMNLVKSLLKITLVGYIGFNYISKNTSTMLKSIQLDKMGSLYMMAVFSINVALRMAAMILIIGFIDYVYQRYSYKKNIKMSKHEVKEEYKQSEGDPQVKSKIKQRQREVATRRMMQDLPQADVIITNPTHYAIALKYNEQKYDAPYVIAKGKNIYDDFITI